MQDVTVEVIEPDPSILCPNQRVVYECTVVECFTLIWMLPTDNGATFDWVFDYFEMLGTRQSNDIFTAVLNRSDPLDIGYLITSTLQITQLDNLNDSSLACAGIPVEGDPVTTMITITVSGE